MTNHDIANINELIYIFTDSKTMKTIRRLILRKNVYRLSIEYINDEMTHYFFDDLKTFELAKELCSIFFIPCKETKNHPVITLFRNKSYA